MKVLYSKIIVLQSCLELVKLCELRKGYCCLNFYRNEDGFCEECPPGTFGTNCTSSCPHGYFGKNCLSECMCSVDECDAKYGCLLQKNVTSHPLSTPALTNISLVRDSPTSLTSQSADSSWKSTTFLLIGVLAVFLLFSGRKTWLAFSVFSQISKANIVKIIRVFKIYIFLHLSSSWVLKRRSRNAQIPPVLFRAVDTSTSQDERLVNVPDESNVPYLQKRCSTPKVYYKQNENDAYSAERKVEGKTDVPEQHYEDDWAENGMLLTKPICKLLSKRDDKPQKANIGFHPSSEDKFRPYSSIKYNKYSRKNTDNRGQALQRESSAEPINEYDDVAPSFTGGSIPMTNETSYLEVEVSSGNAEHEKEELHKLTEAEESECSLYQDIVCGPQGSSMPSCPSYNNHINVSEYETKRFSSEHTVSEDESVHTNNSLYTSLIVDNASKNDLSSNDKDSINLSEL